MVLSQFPCGRVKRFLKNNTQNKMRVGAKGAFVSSFSAGYLLCPVFARRRIGRKQAVKSASEGERRGSCRFAPRYGLRVLSSWLPDSCYLRSFMHFTYAFAFSFSIGCFRQRKCICLLTNRCDSCRVRNRSTRVPDGRGSRACW